MSYTIFTLIIYTVIPHSIFTVIVYLAMSYTIFTLIIYPAMPHTIFTVIVYPAMPHTIFSVIVYPAMPYTIFTVIVYPAMPYTIFTVIVSFLHINWTNMIIFFQSLSRQWGCYLSCSSGVGPDKVVYSGCLSDVLADISHFNIPIPVTDLILSP